MKTVVGMGRNVSATSATKGRPSFAPLQLARFAVSFKVLSTSPFGARRQVGVDLEREFILLPRHPSRMIIRPTTASRI